jgi:hypothetical protein
VTAEVYRCIVADDISFISCSLLIADYPFFNRVLVSQLQRELSSAVSLMHDEQSSAAQATAQLEAKVTVSVTILTVTHFSVTPLP